MSEKMEIMRAAYTIAWCQNGLKYFLTRGFLIWFFLIYLGVTTHLVIFKNSITSFHIFINFFITIFVGLCTGTLVFKILNWQSNKMKNTLTDSEQQKVQEVLKGLCPFRQLILFILFSFIFIFLVSGLVEFLD